MKDVRLTHIGGPTVLIEVGGWRLLTDPTFDPPGRRYPFGWGTVSRKLAGPAIAADDLPPIDAVLLTPRPPRRQPRRRRPRAAPVGRRGRDDRLRRGAARRRRARPRAVADDAARGARPAGDRGHRHAVPARPAAEPSDRRRRRSASRCAGRARSTACCGSRATPCSTTACGEVADRLEVDTALLHLGGVRFPVTGPLRYTMTARDAVELCELVRPRTAIPIHYEGWKHFRQGRAGIEAELASAPRGRPPALSLAADRRGGRPGGSERADTVRACAGCSSPGWAATSAASWGAGRRRPGGRLDGIAGSAQLDVRDAAGGARLRSRRAAGRRRAHRLPPRRPERERRGHAGSRRGGGRRRRAADPPVQRRRLPRDRRAGADRGRRAAPGHARTAPRSSRPSDCARPTR